MASWVMVSWLLLAGNLQPTREVRKPGPPVRMTTTHDPSHHAEYTQNRHLDQGRKTINGDTSRSNTGLCNSREGGEGRSRKAPTWTPATERSGPNANANNLTRRTWTLDTHGRRVASGEGIGRKVEAGPSAIRPRTSPSPPPSPQTKTSTPGASDKRAYRPRNDEDTQPPLLSPPQPPSTHPPLTHTYTD